MTQPTCETQIARSTRTDAEQLLRDMAFALRLGRQAAREILAERPRPAGPVAAEACRPMYAAA